MSNKLMPVYIIFIVFVVIFTALFDLHLKGLVKEYKRGVTNGRKMCEMSRIDNVILPINKGTILKPAPDSELVYYPYIRYSKQKVQSITFKYDSIMIINLDSSEVK